MKSVVTIIGNVFVDLKGISNSGVHKDAKNVGQIHITHGGAARNAAHNIGVLGANCRFVSSYTDDGTGRDVVRALENARVDTSCMRAYVIQGMGRWLAVLDHDGELIASISEQPRLEHQEKTIFGALFDSIEDATAVGLDVGISREVNEKVALACREKGIPLYGIVGNLDVLTCHPESLSGFDTFTCNMEEASLLCGYTLNSRQDAEEACRRILDFGCKRIVITMAEKGAVFLDGVASTPGFVAAKTVTLVDSTGAGDGFFAGMVYALANGATLADAVQVGTDVAAKVIQVDGATLLEPLIP